jgi:predicted dehydrogenase
MSQIITGLASFGMSGKVFHAPLLHHHPQFRIKKIVERSKNEASLLYPYITSVKSFDNLLNDTEIELIIVNTPDNTHFELATRALEAGKHVIVEKPFTQTQEQGEALINLANKKNLYLSVFQNRRWDNDFLTVKEVINKGLLGRLVEFESHFDRYRNFIQSGTWKEDASTGTGTLFNLGSHMIDQALCLFGMPEAIHADVRILRTNGNVDDSYDLKLYYPTVKVTLKGSYLVREAGPRYALHGTLGSFLKFGIDPQEEALKAGKSLNDPNWGKDDENYWGLLNSEINGLHFKGKVETIQGNYLAFYDSIYNSLRNSAPLLVKAEEALNNIKLINAALLSNKTRNSVLL